jgi:hypothetical protein
MLRAYLSSTGVCCATHGRVDLVQAKQGVSAHELCCVFVEWSEVVFCMCSGESVSVADRVVCKWTAQGECAAICTAFESTAKLFCLWTSAPAVHQNVLTKHSDWTWNKSCTLVPVIVCLATGMSVQLVHLQPHPPQ